MEAPTNERVGRSDTRPPQASMYSTAPIFQLVFWTLFGVLFFLIVRPLHPFPDVLAGQSAASAAVGLVFSMSLAWVYRGLMKRGRHPHKAAAVRSEEHTSELQSRDNLV